MIKVRKCIHSILPAILAFISIASAGPSANARTYLDNDFRTAVIEPYGRDVVSGDTCFIAVYVDGVVNLNSYSVMLQFDTSIVQFCSAVAQKSFSEKPFLASSGGQILVLPHQKGNTVEFAATLKGIGHSVSGNGCLGYFTFKSIKNGSPAIAIKEVKLVDEKRTVDKIQ